MAYIVEPEVVKYACTCGLLKPISKLYFCRYCLEVRCGFCVCHEVDILFCNKCLENMPSAEARLRRNNCANCLICPSCALHLSVRAATVSTKSSEHGGHSTRKVVYLYCLMCSWSSRDVGIPDQPTGAPGWPEHENVYANRLTEIMEKYKSVMLREKQDKAEKKKKQHKYMTFTDRTGLTAAIIRKRLGIPNPSIGTKKEECRPATPKESVEDYPEHLFKEPIKLTEVTSIRQRLLQIDSQPRTVDKLFPVHKHLSVKQSLRCRACEHNVSKPEFNPNSIRFKIQLFAYYHIPEIRIVTVEPLRAGKPCELYLKFVNPTQHQTTITVLAWSEVTEKDFENDNTSTDTEPKSLEKAISSLSLSQPSSLISSTLSRHPSITVKPRPIQQSLGAELTIPSSSFILPPRDDAAEYDDSGENYNFQDDPKLVIKRKSNKAIVKLQVTPGAELNIGDEVTVGFVMQHIYTNTIPIEKVKEPQKCEHKLRVVLSLGTLVGSQ